VSAANSLTQPEKKRAEASATEAEAKLAIEAVTKARTIAPTRSKETPPPDGKASMMNEPLFAINQGLCARYRRLPARTCSRAGAGIVARRINTSTAHRASAASAVMCPFVARSRIVRDMHIAKAKISLQDAKI
jgi:hypothetical protein